MELKYLIREPENISSKTTLLVLLHGYGSNEEDLFSFIPTLPKEWLIVSFRAPFDTDFGGYSWFDIDLMNAENPIDVAQAKNAEKEILESILTISNQYGLTENETHLAGFSQGGILTYALALNQPQFFSKIAILSSYLDEKLLVNSSKDKKQLEKLRFFISHGADDAVIPLEWGRKAADYLYHKGCFFSFREYMNGHGINQKNYMDLMEFFNK